MDAINSLRRDVYPRYDLRISSSLFFAPVSLPIYCNFITAFLIRVLFFFLTALTYSHLIKFSVVRV